MLSSSTLLLLNYPLPAQAQVTQPLLTMYFRSLTILVIPCWTLSSFSPSVFNLGSKPGYIIDVASPVLRRGLVITSAFVLVTLVYWVVTHYTMCLGHTNSALLAHVEPDAHRNN